MDHIFTNYHMNWGPFLRKEEFSLPESPWRGLDGSSRFWRSFWRIVCIIFAMNIDETQNNFIFAILFSQAVIGLRQAILGTGQLLCLKSSEINCKTKVVAFAKWPQSLIWMLKITPWNRLNNLRHRLSCHNLV